MISQISLIFFFFWSPELPILPLTLSKRIKGPKNQLDLRVRLFPLVLSSCVHPPRSPSFPPTRHPRRSAARSRSASRRPAAAEAPAAPRRVGGGRLRGGLGLAAGGAPPARPRPVARGPKTVTEPSKLNRFKCANYHFKY